ncbi:hypothetical protein R5R35_014665 [Gryllus longicercus]|uniref:alpha-glucosidase n=1 Tax=Gryllus longicercus TaxID=2509291 RepID=A0AAN9Z179_9ORTH
MSDERETEGVDGSTRLLAGEMGVRPTNSDPEGDGAEEKLVTEDGKLNSNRETSEVKFISADSQNGDAKIDIENVKHTFAGMGKDELMKFANDPFWIRMRWFLFIFFWVLWIAMLVGAVAIIILAPKCAGPAPLKWWEESPLYEVNVRTFVDGEKEDGIGDLVGLKSKLDYIKGLGVKGIVLSSVLQSSHKLEDGYVENFAEVDPLVGTVHDFTNLTAAMKEEGMHLILDFIPNHTSKKHPWFVASEKKESPFTDYYVWTQKEPNNWVSLYGESAWAYSEIRKEYYLHQFKPDQPDLNFRNREVINEFKKIMKLWLERGVSGFQMSNVEFLVEDKDFGEDFVNPHTVVTLGQYDFLQHSKTANLPETYDVLRELRESMLNVSSDSVLAVSSNVTRYGGLVRDNNMTHAFDIMRNADLFSSLKHEFTAVNLNHTIYGWMRATEGYRTFWELGNAYRSRVASRFSPEVVDGLNAVVMLLPGTPITLYGDELGMSDSDGEPRALAPMAWRNSTAAGFSANESISALSLNFQEKNVETEESSEDSHLGIYRTLSKKARTSRSIMYGKFESTVYNDTVYAYTRLKSGNPGYLVVFNPSDYETTANLKESLKSMSDDLTLVVKSPHVEDRKYQASSLYLPAKSMGVFTFVPQQE